MDSGRFNFWQYCFNPRNNAGDGECRGRHLGREGRSGPGGGWSLFACFGRSWPPAFVGRGAFGQRDPPVQSSASQSASDQWHVRPANHVDSALVIDRSVLGGGRARQPSRNLASRVQVSRLMEA